MDGDIKNKQPGLLVPKVCSWVVNSISGGIFFTPFWNG
mgnify:CR=1 FL=1